MKRCFAVLLALAFLLAGALPARAESSLIRLPEVGISLSIPATYIPATRDIEENDLALRLLDMTRDELLADFETFDIYLEAISNDWSAEIVVTMRENSDCESYRSLSDAELEQRTADYWEDAEAYGIYALDSEIYQNAQMKFVKTHLYYADSGVYVLSYSTVNDYKAVEIAMNSYDGDITSEKAAVIQDTVESIRLLEDPQTLSPAFTHTDDKTGLTFTVPAGWEESPPDQEYEPVDVVLSSQQEAGLTMCYGSEDIWEVIPAADKIGYRRSDIDNSFFTCADIADFLEVSSDDVQEVTCGGKSYFLAEESRTDDSYGVETTFDFTYLMRVENGRAYLFTFGGAVDSAYYGDFESLVASAVYPTAAGASPDDGGLSGDASPFGGSVALVLLIVGAVVVVAGVLTAILVPVLVVRSRKKKAARAAAALPPVYPGQPMPPAAPGQPPYAPPAASWQPVAPPPARDSSGEPQTPPAPEAQPAVSPPAAAGGEAAPALTCPACGSRIPPESRFCPACGARVAQGEEGR